MNPAILGLLVLAIPLLILGLLVFWKNYRSVFWVYVGAVAVGLGYLFVQGALNDIGKPVHDVVYGSTAGEPASADKKEKKKAKKKMKKKKAADGGAGSETMSDTQPATDGGNGASVGSTVGSPPGRYVDAPAN